MFKTSVAAFFEHLAFLEHVLSTRETPPKTCLEHVWCFRLLLESGGHATLKYEFPQMCFAPKESCRPLDLAETLHVPQIKGSSQRTFDQTENELTDFSENPETQPQIILNCAAPFTAFFLGGVLLTERILFSAS